MRMVIEEEAARIVLCEVVIGLQCWGGTWA